MYPRLVSVYSVSILNQLILPMKESAFYPEGHRVNDTSAKD